MEERPIYLNKELTSLVKVVAKKLSIPPEQVMLAYKTYFEHMAHGIKTADFYNVPEGEEYSVAYGLKYLGKYVAEKKVIRAINKTLRERNSENFKHKKG